MLVLGKKFIFTEEQKAYIKENWGKESAHSMKKKFGCTWYAVSTTAQSMGLELPDSKAWSDKEVKTLEKLAKELSIEEIASALQRTPNAIYLKAKKLGIVIYESNRKWTLKETERFCALWGNAPIEDISKELHRSINSLKVRAIRLGLGSMLSNSDLLTISDVVELVGISRDRIARWIPLGLAFKKHKLTDSASYYMISREDLLTFLKDNQEEWDARNVVVGSLGEEEDWLIKKRRNDEVANPLWYRRWSKEDDALFKELWGKIPIEDVSEQLQRTVCSLRCRAVVLKLGPMIRNNTDLLMVSDIAFLLHVTIDRVMDRWFMMGLPLFKKKVSQKMEYYVVSWEDLLCFLEKNLDEWDSRNLEVGALGEEKEWLVQKRKIDILENPLWYRKWMPSDEAELRLLWNHFPIQEIASRLNRTILSVQQKASELNLGKVMLLDDDILTLLDINHLLGISCVRILQVWGKLGLPICRCQDGVFHYYYVTWRNLYLFLENHPEEWNIEALGSGFLEPFWLMRKRADDVIASPTQNKRWTREQDHMAEMMFSNGTDISKIAFYLEKPVKSVVRRLEKLGFDMSFIMVDGDEVVVLDRKKQSSE